MLGPRDFLELLVADVAVERGVVSPADAEVALHRGREAAAGARVSLLESLGMAAKAPPATLEEIEIEANRLVAEAGGDPRVAWVRRVGGKRSIHLARSMASPAAPGTVGQSLAQAPGTLRPIPPGRYKDFVVAGEGGMGVVYMALDTDLYRFVALKIVRPDAGSGAPAATPRDPLYATPPSAGSACAPTFRDLTARFLQEAWVTGGLEHPGIVPLYELGQTPSGVPYYTMRFIHGQRTLAGAIEEAAGAGLEERLKLLESFLKVCDTLAYAHAKGVVHRDVKPQNVALGEYGEVVLLDWGLAKLGGSADAASGLWEDRIREYRESNDIRTLASGVGTPGYMSPEAARGDLEEVDARSDVYSIGVILFQILTGRLPDRPRRYLDYVNALSTQPAPDPVDLDPSVPRGLAEICRTSMAPRRTDRTATVDALSSAVRAWQAATALERELDLSRREADEDLARAQRVRGAARLEHVDRAAAAILQIRSKRPGDERGLDLERRAAALRSTGLSEHQQESLRRARRRALLVVGGVLLVVGLGYLTSVIKTALDEQAGRRTLAERERAAEEELAKTEGLLPGPAVEAITALIPRIGGTSTVPRARLRLGERLDDDGRRERAMAAWLECAFLDAPSAPSIEAWKRIVRRLLDEGNPALARDGIAAALRVAARADDRSAIHLLEAEALWAEGLPEEAVASLSEATAEAPTSTETAAGADTLRGILPLLSPRRPFEGTGGAHVVIGRFGGGRLEIVRGMKDPSRQEVHALGASGVDEKARLTWQLPLPVFDSMTCDLNGDGIDEFVEVSYPTGVPDAEAYEHQGTLRVLDLSGSVPVELARVDAPHGGLVMAAGDVDGDGDLDFVLGAHYPGRGVSVIENLGGLRFAQMPNLGDLGGDDLRRANVRSLAIADVTGDGRKEILLGCSEWRLYDLEAFRYDSTARTFVRVPVERKVGSGRLGLVNSLVVPHDVDGNGRLAAVFATDCMIYEDLQSAAKEFLPQGLHQATWDEDRGRLLVETVLSHDKIRVKPASGDDALPVNQGTERMVLARTKAGGSWLVTQGRTYAGSAVIADWLRMYPASALEGGNGVAARKFTHRVDHPVIQLLAWDLDGDGNDEVLVLEKDGTLTALDLSGVGPAPELERQTRAAPRGPPAVGTTRLDVAEWFGKLGWHHQAEQEYIRLLGESHDLRGEGLARAGLVDEIVRQWRWGDILHQLRSEAGSPGLSRADRSLRLAHYLDRTQQWGEAAGEYARILREGLAGDREKWAVEDREVQLRPWLRTKAEALPGSDPWSSSEPRSLEVNGSEIRTSDKGSGDTAVWLPIDNDHESFRLEFEIEVALLTDGHGLQVGFVDTRSERAYFSPGLSMMVQSSSMQANRVDLGPDVGDGVPLDGGDEQPRTLEAGVPYRGVLSWDARGQRFGVTFWRGTDPEIVVSLMCRPGPRAFLDPRRLGVRLATEGHSGTSRFRVRIDRLSRPLGR